MGGLDISFSEYLGPQLRNIYFDPVFAGTIRGREKYPIQNAEPVELRSYRGGRGSSGIGQTGDFPERLNEEPEEEENNRMQTRRMTTRITEPLTFSEQIAFDQFFLAIERNFLLHITTGLNMTVVGLAMFRFFSRNENDLYEIVGGGAFLVAASIIAKGTRDFVRMKQDLARLEEKIRQFGPGEAEIPSG